jgi:hypothetical protein
MQITNRWCPVGGEVSRQGHLKGRVGGSHKQRRGPLRKIVEVIGYGFNMFDQNRVLLECGHEAKSNGQYKARCSKCAEAPLPNAPNSRSARDEPKV